MNTYSPFFFALLGIIILGVGTLSIYRYWPEPTPMALNTWYELDETIGHDNDPAYQLHMIQKQPHIYQGSASDKKHTTSSSTADQIAKEDQTTEDVAQRANLLYPESGHTFVVAAFTLRSGDGENFTKQVALVTDTGERLPLHKEATETLARHFPEPKKGQINQLVQVVFELPSTVATFGVSVGDDRPIFWDESMQRILQPTPL